jgi:hypothetical protein
MELSLIKKGKTTPLPSQPPVVKELLSPGRALTLGLGLEVGDPSKKFRHLHQNGPCHRTSGPSLAQSFSRHRQWITVQCTSPKQRPPYRHTPYFHLSSRHCCRLAGPCSTRGGWVQGLDLAVATVAATKMVVEPRPPPNPQPDSPRHNISRVTQHFLAAQEGGGLQGLGLGVVTFRKRQDQGPTPAPTPTTSLL